MNTWQKIIGQGSLSWPHPSSWWYHQSGPPSSSPALVCIGILRTHGVFKPAMTHEHASKTLWELCPKKVEYFIFPIVIKHIENHIWPSVELFLKCFCSIFSIESAGLPTCQCVVLHFLMDGGWWLTLSIWGHLSLHDSLLSNTMANTRQSIYLSIYLSIHSQIKEIIYNCTRLYCTYAIGLDVCNGNVLLFSDRCLQKLSTTSSSGKKCHEYVRARCIKTPLMTPTAAKPNTPLKRMVSRLKAGLRSSCASRATGTQVPRVIWNIVSIPGDKDQLMMVLQ